MDPEALVNSVTYSDVELRRTIVDGLYRLATDGSLNRRWFQSYEPLRHPGLVAQVRPWLNHEVEEVRTLAYDLCRDCKLDELRLELAAIGLNAELSPRERARANWALVSLGRMRRSANYAIWQ